MAKFYKDSVENLTYILQQCISPLDTLNTGLQYIFIKIQLPKESITSSIYIINIVGAATVAKPAQKPLNKAIQHRNPTPRTGKPYKTTSPPSA